MIKVATNLEITGGLLVGQDGSKQSEVAVRWAADVAARLGTPLHIVRAWSLSSAPRPASATAAGATDDRLRGRRAGAPEHDVAQLGSVQGRRALPRDPRTGGTPPARGRRARRAARHRLPRRRPLHGLRFGSTADQVVRHAHHPVVVIPVAGSDDPPDLDAELTAHEFPGLPRCRPTTAAGVKRVEDRGLGPAEVFDLPRSPTPRGCSAPPSSASSATTRRAGATGPTRGHLPRLPLRHPGRDRRRRGRWQAWRTASCTLHVGPPRPSQRRHRLRTPRRRADLGTRRRRHQADPVGRANQRHAATLYAGRLHGNRRIRTLAEQPVT